MSSNWTNLKPYRNLNRDQGYAKWEDYYYQKDTEFAMGPYFYQTDPNRNWPLANCAQFAPFVGNPHLKSWGIDRSMIHTESDLRNQIKPYSKCPSQKYSPQEKGSMMNCYDCPSCNLGLPCDCSHCKLNNNKNGNNNCSRMKQITPLQTRPFGKACNLPGVFINRFEDTCFNFQNPATIHSNSYIGLDTRNNTKDNYNLFDVSKMAKVAKMPYKAACRAGSLGCSIYP